MIKSSVGYSNPVANALAYSYKNLGTMRSDRSIKSELTVEERFIAPPNLIGKMAEGIPIHFGIDFDNDFPPFIISTIPMPALMKLLNYPHRQKFSSIPGLNIRAQIDNCDAYVSQIIPDPAVPFSRLSITGRELIMEVSLKQSYSHASNYDALAWECVEKASELTRIPFDWFSEVQWTESKYQKIVPIDDDERKQFIFWATDQHGIFSLGRFGTWRPNLLLDDLVHDIQLIDRWLQKPDRYAIAKHRR